MERWETAQHKETQGQVCMVVVELDVAVVHYECHSRCEMACHYEMHDRHCLEFGDLDMEVESHIDFVHRDMVKGSLILHCCKLSVLTVTEFAGNHSALQPFGLEAESHSACFEIAVAEVENEIDTRGQIVEIHYHY